VSTDQRFGPGAVGLLRPTADRDDRGAEPAMPGTTTPATA